MGTEDVQKGAKGRREKHTRCEEDTKHRERGAEHDTHMCAHAHTHTGMKGKCSKKLGLMTKIAQSNQGQAVTGGSGAVFKRRA